MAARPPDGARRRARPGDDPLAARCRSAYVRARSQAETDRRGVPFAWRPPRAYDGRPPATVDGAVVEDRGAAPVWPKLAAFCRENDLDPDAYVAWVFADRGLGRIPEPLQVITRAALAAYRGAAAQEEGRLAEALGIQQAVARRHVLVLTAIRGDRDAATAEVLTDPVLPLSALFRLCLARSLDGKVFARIARLYQTAAAVQFQPLRRAYRRAWRGWLPRDFVAEAADLYRAWLDAGDGR